MQQSVAFHYEWYSIFVMVDAGLLPLQCEIQVEHGGDMWWTMPHFCSDPIIQTWQQGYREVSFIWDWKDTRIGSYKLNGQTTSISRYIINFDTMYQRNIDKPNKDNRKVKVVWVIPWSSWLRWLRAILKQSVCSRGSAYTDVVTPVW